MMRIHSEISVCQCCMLVQANGECCDSHEPGSAYEPLSSWEGSNYSLSLSGKHSIHCRGADDCDCDHHGFSWSSCEGCGSSLGGDRYAMTVFYR